MSASKVMLKGKGTERLPWMTIKYHRTTTDVSFTNDANVHDLAMAVFRMLDIPVQEQKFLCRGRNILKGPEQLADVLLPLAGQKVILLGRTTQTVSSMQATSVGLKQQALQKHHYRMKKATELFNAKMKRTISIVGTGRPPSPLNRRELTQGEDYDEVSHYRRFFGRRAPGLGSTHGGTVSKERLEAYIGTGLFPRLDCKHLFGKIRGHPEYSCRDCREFFLYEFFVIVLYHHSELYRDATDAFHAHRTHEVHQHLHYLHVEHKGLREQTQAPLKIGDGGMMEGLLEDWEDELDLELMCPQNSHADGVVKDLSMLDLVLALCEGMDPWIGMKEEIVLQTGQLVQREVTSTPEKQIPDSR